MTDEPSDLTALRADVSALSDKLDLHTEVDLQAHALAAQSRTEVLAMVTETRNSVAGLVEAWVALAGVVKVAKWVGKFIAWVGGIATAIAAGWALVRMFFRG